MNLSYQEMLQEGEHGLERETLRIRKNAKLSPSPHPQSFGSPLMNPHISTDFSEPQLELITPVFKTQDGLLNYLTDLHAFVAQNLPKNEFLWPFSMPALLPKNHEEIPLANYGKSFAAQKRTIYRRGLSFRYGRKMQTISGIHYNFSFSKEFWDSMYKKSTDKSQSKQDFITAGYFRMIQNFSQISWLDSYLFGASPAIDKSYLGKTYYGKYATSLRMSSFGYCCKVQAMLNISFRNLESYVADLKKAIATPYKKYSKIGIEKDGKKLQLNNHFLQIPNEYYASIRPKQSIKLGEDILNKLLKEGIRYLEIRTVDIDPNEPIGISREHLKFLHLMMIYCFVKDPPQVTDTSQLANIKNHNLVAIYGRKRGLKLVFQGKKIALQKWGNDILTAMLKIAASFDKKKLYQGLLERQIAKINDPALTPSAKFLEQIKQKGLLKTGQKLAQKNLALLKNHQLNTATLKRFQEEAAKSIKENLQLENLNAQQTEGFEDMEYSTQLLIKAAQKRSIKVEIIDRKANFLRLSKGNNIKYIQQATFTHLDSVTTYLITGNKNITKKLLKENKINVPIGKDYSSLEAALKDYPLYAGKKLVIKPTTTNYGIGIHFVEADDKKAFGKAVEDCLKLDKTVIVEEFAEGEEHRFLVMGEKVVGVLKRVPANILGDGKSTILQLVKKKNFYRVYPGFIKIGKTELAMLKKQKLTPKSIPMKGRKIFLRENSNISTGGDAIGMTQKVSRHFKKIAIKAAKVAQAKICGIDMIIKGKNYSIIELNYNPVLKPHAFPHEGQSVDVTTPLLDLLGF
ncbi:glutamate--cysteine ligase [Candidatus Peregrinibacteria bacterium]|nr:glutamate--cysteine ligase [Candidatus Peregrinibacteria bacterium]